VKKRTGADVRSVQQQDTLESRRDAETACEVGDRGPVGELDDGAA
jgi:hypothetical protein